MTRPDLEAISRPTRRNGIKTFEVILATAGELLAEVGFERLTTNLVCDRAGLTYPALYRYFPNKYALLSELARRLMEAQDNEVFAWLEEEGGQWPTREAAVQASIRLQKRVIAATRRQPGGPWILRAIRAIPVLEEVRTASRNKVLDRFFEQRRASFPDIGEERLRIGMRLAEQMSYATIEMLVEDPQLDEHLVIEEVAWMISGYYANLSKRPPLGPA